jgi:hypothetical protein
MTTPHTGNTPTGAVIELVDFDTTRKILGNMSRETLRQEMAAGRINGRHIGRKVVFRPEELKRYADALPSWEPK